MKIVQIGFANFRSIGPEPVMLDLRKRINFLIGANNSGKSNVLDVLRRVAPLTASNLDMADVDRHKRTDKNIFELIFEIEEAATNAFPRGKVMFVFGVTRDKLLWKQSPFDNLYWHDLGNYLIEWGKQAWSSTPSQQEVARARQSLSASVVDEILKEMPVLHLIPQFRKITTGEYSIEGSGIPELLEKWKSPAIGKDEDRNRFKKVEEFLRELLGMVDVALDVSRQDTEIIVERDGLRLPLSNYGTGIHQLIILAIAVLAHENALIGIEEPEIHLHPLLQKAFLKFLVEKTTNHYVITTHSNAFLSQPVDSHITHLWLENGETKSRAVETTEHILDVLSDLGVRAADIMQANFVIWVEGPSDRIYLNHWLKLVDPELTEGLDYAIMFYGGRLLAHLSMEREEGDLSTEEFIKLLRINQHAAILIDSDKASKNTKVNPTKKRISDECAECGVLCWITKGREIENYLAPEAISKAYADITGKAKEIAIEPFEKIDEVVKHAYVAEWKPKFAYEGNKPGFARRIMAQTSSVPDRLNLRERLSELVEAIREAK